MNLKISTLISILILNLNAIDIKSFPELEAYKFSDDLWNSHGYFTAKGSWYMENDKMAEPITSSKIICLRDLQICIDAKAIYQIFNSFANKPYLYAENEIYQIERWDNNEIVTKPLDSLCTRYIMTINRNLKTVRLNRTPINLKYKFCEGVEKKELKLKLINGSDIKKRLKGDKRIEN